MKVATRDRKERVWYAVDSCLSQCVCAVKTAVNGRRLRTFPPLQTACWPCFIDLSVWLSVVWKRSLKLTAVCILAFSNSPQLLYLTRQLTCPGTHHGTVSFFPPFLLRFCQHTEMSACRGEATSTSESDSRLSGKQQVWLSAVLYWDTFSLPACPFLLWFRIE